MMGPNSEVTLIQINVAAEKEAVFVAVYEFGGASGLNGRGRLVRFFVRQ